jgi:hypothetical protein
MEQKKRKKYVARQARRVGHFSRHIWARGVMMLLSRTDIFSGG